MNNGNDEELNDLWLKSINKALDVIDNLPGDAGAIECPLCKNRLEWIRASNGHVSGKCSNKNCLDWVQ